MDPVVGLRLTHLKLPRVQRLQRVGLLIDQNKQKFVFEALQHAFDAATSTALPGFAGTRQRRWIALFVGLLKRGQQLLKLFQG